jgi:hypothetical protein
MSWKEMPTTAQQKDPVWIAKGADAISEAILHFAQTGEGVLIGRQGTLEFDCLYLHWIVNETISEDMRNKLQTNAGVFPATELAIKVWVQEYTSALQESAILASGWNPDSSEHENQFLQEAVPNAKQIVLRALEPYYVEPEKRWTRLLAGKKVCIVSSFADTMRSQVSRRRQIWPADADSLLPDSAEWSFVKTRYPDVLGKTSSCVWDSATTDWTKALKQVHAEVLQTGADIVLVGWGALGMILGKHLKKKGKCVIVMGGAIQNLLGIKGSRWRSHPIISHFWNEAWISPAEEEVPPHAFSVESGCYW